MQALGKDMAAAVAIHPGNPIPTLLLPPAKWALPESTRKKPSSFEAWVQSSASLGKSWQQSPE
jgi:hypothetical protein